MDMEVVEREQIGEERVWSSISSWAEQACGVFIIVNIKCALTCFCQLTNRRLQMRCELDRNAKGKMWLTENTRIWDRRDGGRHEKWRRW